MPYPEAVETDHLSLRRWRSDDGPAMDAIWRERDIWSALRPDIPFDPDAGAAMLNRHVGHWDRHGFGLWAVMERHSDEIIGWVGPSHPAFIPELSDKAKGQALTSRVATELLPELGFKDSELADLATGKSKLSIYDHRVQRLLADAVKLRDIQSAKTAAVAKPVPPVVKPGTAKPAGAANSERIQVLTRQLESSGSLKAAQELRAAQIAARRRA